VVAAEPGLDQGLATTIVTRTPATSRLTSYPTWRLLAVAGPGVPVSIVVILHMLVNDSVEVEFLS